MADIDVVKKGSKTWLWVLLVVVVLLGMWFMFGRSERRVGYQFEGGQPHAAALSPVAATAAV